MQALAERHVDYDWLYRTHQPRVLRLCRMLLSDPDEADDVTQEVFLKLMRYRPADCATIAWGPWLTKVTVNACRDRRRSGWWRWWREGGREIQDTDLPNAVATPEREALGREERWRVWRSFRKLSSRQQEVFALRQIEGWSTEEVAEILGVSTGSVKRHLFRAVHQLREALRGQP